ncbi:hypothetical protein [Nocardia wallacei]|uniref:hypothetical protein n=1 Tax=Nocardia wallacei TaxID=480035 RepID=UPI002453CD71|nr:hypothetical protein [Nocardia wallacei]
MSAAKRTVVVGLMTYQRPDGRFRMAYAGDEVEVHPDFLERFDRINVLQGQEPAADAPATTATDDDGDEKPATKRRTTARKES